MPEPTYERFEPYTAAAAGWGGLISSLKHTAKERDVAGISLALLRVNQKDGFDCPGCAWPEPAHRSPFEFCENGVKAVAFEATGKRVTPEFFAQHQVSFLRQQTDHWLEGQGRLTHPMRYDATTDRYVPIAWNDAFALIAKHLHSLTHPDQAIFYTSGRTSNEAAFMYQLFGRVFGTNNFPDCSNMCHESSGCALNESIGVGKGTVLLDDFEKADAIFVIGQNPGTNHPRMLTVLEAAAKRGAAIVTLNPLRERGLESFIHPQKPLPMLTGSATSISTHYYQVLIGGDLAALKGIMKLVIEAEDRKPGTVLDHAFIREHTVGSEAFIEDLRNTSWNDILKQSGLTREQLHEAAEVYLKARSVIFCWAMGLTQHKHAVPTIQQIVNLLLLRGNLGRPGAGACPVRGHSNVQGDRTMGITELPKPDFLDRLRDVFGFEPPRHHGLDVVGALKAMHEGKAHVFIGMGGNLVAASPDSAFTEAAFATCNLTVGIATKLNRSHVVHGSDALILPCLGRTELDVQATGPQFVTVEDSMSMVHKSEGTKRPASDHLLSEPAIVAGIAAATFPQSTIPWREMASKYDLIRDFIARVLPGFKDFNQRVREPGGFYLGNSARDRRWNTRGNKAHFIAAPIPDLTLPAGQLRMMTIRSHDQYNTTVYALDDRYRGIFGARRVVLMHEEDIAARGLKDGEAVDLHSITREDGSVRSAPNFRVVKYDIPRSCAATYFPETNVLVSVDSYADRSRTPLSKFVPIVVLKTGSPTPKPVHAHQDVHLTTGVGACESTPGQSAGL